MKRKWRLNTPQIDFEDNTLDINVYQPDVPIQTLRTVIVSGPVTPQPGERIVLEVVGVKRAEWHTR